tara:strand:+ start:236 stop:1060 length:825 start_codon:yes stop_codon:yes gene_type:complete
MTIIKYKKVLEEGIISFFENPYEKTDDFSEQGIENILKAEKVHFWHKHRLQYIKDKFSKFVDVESKVLEIGCGTGYLAKELQDNGYNITVSEYYLSGLRHAKTIGIKNCYQLNVYDPPFVNEFDIICMFDVLEHLDHEETVFENLTSMLSENGKLILTLPAYNWLWSRSDHIAGHKRRYDMKMINKISETFNMKVLVFNYFFILSFPLLILRRLIDPDNGKEISNLEINAPIKPPHPIINKILQYVCFIEQFIPNKLTKFFGGSIFVILGKNEK